MQGFIVHLFPLVRHERFDAANGSFCGQHLRRSFPSNLRFERQAAAPEPVLYKPVGFARGFSYNPQRFGVFGGKRVGYQLSLQKYRGNIRYFGAAPV